MTRRRSLIGKYTPTIVKHFINVFCRIKGDDSTTVVVKYNGDIEPLTDVQGTDGTYGASIFWIHTVGVTYGSDDESSKREVWVRPSLIIPITISLSLTEDIHRTMVNSKICFSPPVPFRSPMSCATQLMYTSS